MSEYGFKVLALVSALIVGYFYARKGKPQAAMRVNLLNSMKEVQDDDNSVAENIKETPLSELIRHANIRLRKRREGKGK